MRVHRLIPAGTHAWLGARALFTLVLAVAAVASGPAAGATPSACVEDDAGGKQYCGPNVTTSWSYGDCDDFPATVARERAWCLASGGTSFNAVDGSCPGFTPFTEDNLVSRAVAFEQILTGVPAALDSDTGWGTTFPNTGLNCGGGNGPLFKDGYYIGDWRLLIVNGARIIASKTRGLECPPGYVNSTYFTLRGWMCSKPLDPVPTCSTCPLGGPNGQATSGSAGGAPGFGNPITPTTGVKVETETDYRGAGGLELTRYYHSLRFTEPYSLDPNAHSENRFDIVWRSNFDRRIIPIPGTISSFVNAALTFPNGGIQYFNLAGNEVYTNGASAHLVTAPEGWYYVTPDETDFFGTDGRLRSISTRTGQVLTMSYSDGTAGSPNGGYTVDAAGNPTATVLPASWLLRVTDAYGNTLSFTYSGAGHIVTMTDPAGGRYLYSYDGRQHLTSVQRPDGSTRTYNYNEAGSIAVNPTYSHALTSIVDENGGLYASFKYDANGYAYSTQHGGGVEHYQLSYLAGLNNQIAATATTSVTDPLGTVRTFSFSNAGGIRRYTGTTQAGGAGYGSGVKSRTVDANGNTTSQTDFNNVTTCYAYDTARNLETVRVEGAPASTSCASVLSAGASLPAGSRKILTQWHPRWRVPVAVSEPGRRTTNVYNGDAGCAPASAEINEGGGRLQPIGVLCSKTVQATSDITDGGQGFGAALVGVPRTTTYTYDAHGKVLTIDGARTDVADITSYAYYPDDDPNVGNRGNVASITNALGQTTQITAYNGNGQPLTVVDANGLTTTLTYDSRMHLTSRSVGGETTSYSYDAVGQLVQVTLPDTSFLTYTYDGAHRLTGIADNLGNKIAYTLDAMGNRTQEQVLDPANNIAQKRSRVYNALNQLFQDIGAQGQTTQYAYDAQGNVISVTDPLNRVTSNGYDALYHLVQVTDPNLGLTKYGYNGIDQLVSVTDPRTLTTTYNYDGLSNLNSQISPDTGTTQNTYDSAGNLLTQTDAKGQTTTYVYDALNRIASITFADGSKQVYTYDQGNNAIGRLASIAEYDPAQNQTSLLTYSYDQHGRVITETRTVAGVAYVTGYQYDSAGRLSGMTYPSGRTIAYSFDALGRINQVTTTAPAAAGGQTQVLASNVGYQPFGGVNGYLLGNGQSYTRGFDTDGRIASYNLGAATYALGYDAASRILFINDTGNPQNSNTYGYDNLDRLTSATLPNVPFAYGYDAVGNRLTKTVGSATDSYSYSATSNQLAAISGSSNRSFTFDANGSTTNDGNNQYVYDARGRMVQSVGALGSTAYQVNALGQRIRKTNSSDDRVFVYDTRGRLITESTPAGSLLREYLYLNDIPLAVIQ